MTRILILSKNSLAEQDLQCSLQRMNEEVYCSSSLLPQADSCLDLIKYFSVVIISDTIATIELEAFLPNILETGAKILRRGDSELIKNGEYAWMLDEIDGWIDDKMTISEITEIIVRMRSKNNEVLCSDKQVSLDQQDYRGIPNIDFKQFISYLSKNERRVLFHIYDAKGFTISREELCQAIWEMPSTNSTLSQLSAITYRIKKKITDMGFGIDELQTVWGQGYRMGNAMHSFLSQNNFLVTP